MTVKELVDLLSTLPQDAHVALPHYWDHDSQQFDVISERSVSVESGTPAKPGSTSVFIASKDGDGQPVVVIS